jgi:protein TonB
VGLREPSAPRASPPISPPAPASAKVAATKPQTAKAPTGEAEFAALSNDDLGSRSDPSSRNQDRGDAAGVHEAPDGNSPGSLGAEGGAGGTASYEQTLAAWLDRHKYYPSSLRRRGVEGEGKLRVTIARSGRLLKVDVAAGFTHPALAEISREWVRRAEPFPPVPESVSGEDFVFVVPIAFRLR